MEEKLGALWVGCNDDDSATIISEVYSLEFDKLFIICKRKDGLFMPFSLKKGNDPQWSLPIWVPENEKVLVSTIEEAHVYLSNYGAAS